MSNSSSGTKLPWKPSFTGPLRSVEPEPFDPKPLTGVFKNIYCQRSGELLMVMNITIVEGHIPYLQAQADTIALHPFYQLDTSVVMRKLDESLRRHREHGWIVPEPEQKRLRLLMSALMWHLNAIKQDTPGLPNYEVAVGNAGRLWHLANWYYGVSSQRLHFPEFFVSKRNGNTHWENYKIWLDAAFEIKTDWANKSRGMRDEARKKALEDALVDIRSESMKRVDQKKVWNWIDIQLSAKGVPEGRRVTFKDLFINGDINFADWTADDVDDLAFEINDKCDIDYHIMPYIRQRLKGIRALVGEFYGGFTLLDRIREDRFGDAAKSPILEEFDKKVEGLTELPQPPQRKDFTTNGLFMQAEARWRILKKRWDAKLAKEKELPKPSLPQNDEDITPEDL